MSIKFLLLGWVFLGGGRGSADFIFMGARIFLNFSRQLRMKFLILGNETSSRSSSARIFWHPLGSWTSARSGHGCPHPHPYFSKVSRGCPKFLIRDVRANDPKRLRDTWPKKHSLWAAFFFFPS